MRQQTPDLRGPQPLTPQARPVDTYYLPALQPVAKPARTNGLIQLAESLRAIQPGIDQFVDKQITKFRDQDIAKGTESALKNRQGFNEAIKQGLIPAGASPWFRIGYEQQMLRLIGTEYDQDLRSAYTQSPLRNEDDISDLLAGQRDQLFQTIDAQGFRPEDIQDILMPTLQRSESNLTAHHARERMKQIEIEAEENTALAIGNTLDNHYQTALVGDSRNQMLDGLGQQIAGEVNNMVANGLSGTKANQIMVDAILTHALNTEDIAVIELLDHINTGNGTLGKTGYAKEKRGAMEDRILAIQERRERFTWAQADRDRDEKIETLQTQVMMKIINDPAADITADVKTLAVLDPEKARAVFAFQEARLDVQHKVRDNHYLLSALQAGIYTQQTTAHDVLMAVANRELSGNTGARLLEDLNRYQQDTQTQSLLDNDYVRLLKQNLRTAIQKGDGFGGFDNDSILRANQAEIRFVRAAQQFAQANQGADEEALFEQLRKVYDTIVNDPVYTDSSKPVPGNRPKQASPPKQSAPAKKPTASKPATSQTQPTFTQPKFYTSLAGFEAAMDAGELDQQMKDLQVAPENRETFIEKLRRYAEIQDQLKAIREAKQSQ